ncbi:TPA: hypothetical protein DDW35_00460 [Candidatus Sumerlaeota bacterium]|nr:hypothetical protein [Candidatus Sumerlaeota bacterium]
MALDFRNKFSWSFSRHKTFNECLRRYYYTYYGSWGGWNEDGPEEARLAYRFKCMTSMPMWLGDLVHRMAERILSDASNAELNSLESYQKQLRHWMNTEYIKSVEKKWAKSPKHNLNLFEHYYGTEIDAENRAAAREKVFRCLEHFLCSPLFERLTRLKPAEWKSIEKLDSFEVEGAPVYVKIDCATQADGVLSIYDWKTGAVTTDTETQLACYARYAFERWHVPLDKQRLISYYLDANEVQEHIPSADELVEVKDFIIASMGQMIERLDSGMRDNKASITNFPMTETQWVCKRCFFRELCYKTRNWPPDVPVSE